jgi:hypothetical protein
LVLSPDACPATTRATVASSHMAITGQWCRQQNRPMK